ncbi:MAG: primosomal protein N' [Phycisphaerae bacterium]|nr:primosomal protein N' [Phycisphaerae bacterium]
MGKLFETSEASDAAGGRVVAVAVSAGVWRTFDYAWPASLGEPQRGRRVRVPFGRGDRRTLGFVAETDRPPGERTLKSVAEVLEDDTQFDETLWKLGQWVSHYYLAAPGVTLSAMVPAAVGRHRPRSETVVSLKAATRRDWPGGLGAKQRKVLDELYEARKQGVEPLELSELLRHSSAGRDTVRRLAARDLVAMAERPVHLVELAGEPEPDPFELNADQHAAFETIRAKLGAGYSATLLYGVTGSGKTEVYVRCIRDVVAAGRQALLLVPEIALATQTLQRLVRRLPRVAVLHSGLSDADRAFYWRQIRTGAASVVVGPRSAVFAPARRLGLIVVDEEHEGSYKQDTAPRYHGRDVAVKRAALAGVPIVLGSATPSLESLANVRRERYDLCRLPHRVQGLPMPALGVVHLRKDMPARGDGGPGPRIELLGRTLTRKIADTLDRDEQVILLMNRRGYASHVLCPKCQWLMTCDDCTRAMVFHQATQTVVCHYCGRTASLPAACPACGGKLLLFGLGIQRIENELARKFPAAHVARMDSDTMTSPKQFQKVFDDVRSGAVDILLGTQMVAKGLDFPRVSLVGVASADTALAVDDFRASERTFQLIVQVAGRAGRAERPGEVVVQTLHEDEPAVRFATSHDYLGFAKWELPLRKEAGVPPFSRLMRFVVRHKDADRAHAGATELGRLLGELVGDAAVRRFGPQPAAVKKIRGQFRWEVQLYTDRPGAVQDRVAPHMEDLTRRVKADLYADVDPLNLL